MTMHPIVEEDVQAICDGLGGLAAAFSGKTILISGGAGFLGSFVTATLERLNETRLPEPCRVIVLDNYATGSRASPIGKDSFPHTEIRSTDVRHPIDIGGPVDHILHMAGIASPRYYRQQPIETIEGIVWGAKNLLDLALTKHPESVLVFSSSEIYGDPLPGAVPTPETYRGNVSSMGPRSCYDEAKRLSETLATAYWEFHGVPIRIVRPFNVYGPGMKPNDYRVIPTFIMSAFTGEPLVVYGSGEQTRTFCYVRDAITDFLRVLVAGRPGEAYNVGNDEGEIGMTALARMVSDAVVPSVPIEVRDYPDVYPGDEPQRRCPDLTKIRDHVGIGPRTGLRDGLARTMKWFHATHQGERRHAAIATPPA